MNAFKQTIAACGAAAAAAGIGAEQQQQRQHGSRISSSCSISNSR